MSRFFSNIKFQNKIFLICLLTSLLPTIILGLFCYRQVAKDSFEREKIVLKDTLVQESNNIYNQLTIYENVMKHIIYDKSLENSLSHNYYKIYDMYIVYRDSIDPLFNTIRGLYPDIQDVTIYTDLEINYRNSSLLPISEIEQLSWYPEANSNYKPLWIASKEDQSLLLVQKIYDVLEGHSAFIQIKLNYNNFFKSLSSLYKHSYGVILTHHSNTPIYTFQTDDSVTLTDSQYTSLISSDTIYSDIDNIISEYITFHNDWKIIIYRPAYIISDSIQIISRTTLIIIAICIIGTSLLSFFFSYSIVRPLNMLMDNIIQVEKGNYEINMTYDSSDEIGSLIKSFQNMLKQIKHLINEILQTKLLQQEAELRVLQAQISPHFLHNALSVLNSQAILHGQKEISWTTQCLSRFYRTSLNNGKTITNICNELENIRAYINIQLIMHSNSFKVIYDIDDEILPYTIINFLLQPLVENAILHGIDQRTADGTAYLKIIGKQTEDNVILQIIDNGPGIPPAQLSLILSDRSSSYGIYNVHNRIQLYYGPSYGLSYESSLNGTTVTVTIPINHI